MKPFLLSLTLCLTLGVINAKAAETLPTSKATKQLRLPITIYSKFDVTVSGQIKGRITDIVNVGDKVSKGQVLAVFDQAYEHQIKQHYQSQATSIRKQIDLLTSQVKRYRVLANEKSISEEQNESKQLALLQLEQQLYGLKIRISNVDDAINRKTLKAQYDGTVYQRHVNIGEAVSADTHLLSLLAHKPLHIKTQIPQAMVGQVDMHSATLELNNPTSGTLLFDYLSSVVSPKSNTVEASFEIKHWQQLMPGQKGHMILNYQSH
jgi:RND family efflux transporter MFP subunit